MCFSSPNHSRTDGYRCITCNFGAFHKECALSLSELKHPYHPRHSLSLFPIPHDQKSEMMCSCCGDELGEGWAYQCSICKFFLHLLCAKKPPVIELDRPKIHEHKLFLLPRPRPFTCDACGLTLGSFSLPYACLQCGVMLHRDCINLPRVVRISRHHHRLCYTSSPLPSQDLLSCKICRKVVDNRYGAYSCIKDRHYVVHSKCATGEDVWDGQDLYGEPEDPEDDEAPFEVIDDKVIHHFSHDHNLELNDEDDASFDRSEHCGICALPIRVHSSSFYSCIQLDCNFILHEKCANLPKNTWYMLHPHRLKLHACGTMSVACGACIENTCGLMYKCCKENCGFKVDVVCASVSEPFIHTSHPHPLFATSTSMSMRGRECSGCKRSHFYSKKMECVECDFVLCFRCITLPATVRYKQDRHPLALGIGEGAKAGSWWCEICEGKIEPGEEMYYTCDSCCVTVHVHCIIGKYPHMTSGHYRHPLLGELEVVSNIGCSRPFCHICQRRCPFPIVFKRNGHDLCNLNCLYTFITK